MNRLFHLHYMKIHIFFFEIKIYLSGRVSLGPHTIVISYDTDSTTPGALYGQSHTCFIIYKETENLFYDLTLTPK